MRVQNDTTTLYARSLQREYSSHLTHYPYYFHHHCCQISVCGPHMNLVVCTSSVYVYVYACTCGVHKCTHKFPLTCSWATGYCVIGQTRRPNTGKINQRYRKCYVAVVPAIAISALSSSPPNFIKSGDGFSFDLKRIAKPSLLPSFLLHPANDVTVNRLQGTTGRFYCRIACSSGAETPCGLLAPLAGVALESASLWNRTQKRFSVPEDTT